MTNLHSTMTTNHSLCSILYCKATDRTTNATEAPPPRERQLSPPSCVRRRAVKRFNRFLRYTCTTCSTALSIHSRYGRFAHSACFSSSASAFAFHSPLLAGLSLMKAINASMTCDVASHTQCVPPRERLPRARCAATAEALGEAP